MQTFLDIILNTKLLQGYVVRDITFVHISTTKTFILIEIFLTRKVNT